MAAVLKLFYIEARKEDGTAYNKSTLNSFRFGLNRHYLSTRDINIINDPAFNETNKVFGAKCVELKGAVSYFTHIFFSFFLAFLQTSYGFSLIKTYKLHYFYLILYSETTDRGEITVTTTFTSGLDLCTFPCFKYIVYQVNSFALIAK